MGAKYTEEYLINELKRVYYLLGRTPKCSELGKYGAPNKTTYTNRFGNYSTACSLAGIPIIRVRKTLTDEDLLYFLKIEYKKLQRPLTIDDFKGVNGLPHHSTIEKRFGGFTKAARLANVPTVSHYGFSDDELLTMLHEIHDKLGAPPTRDDLKENGLPSATIYRERFGSLTNALKLIGVVNRQRWEESDEELLSKLKDLADKLGRCPHSSEVHLHGLPTEVTYRNKFGSYTKALILAGITDNVHSNGNYRGIKCLADDGTMCYSLAELKITNFLISNGVSFEKEVKYPNSNYRTDWKVGDYFIEYFGLVGKRDYDEKILLKRKICEENGITLIELYQRDLNKLDESLYKKIAA